MTASELQDLIVSRLTREHGGTRPAWRRAVGAIRVHDPVTHPHCNWSIAPSGSARANEAIEELLDQLRLQYPQVSHG